MLGRNAEGGEGTTGLWSLFSGFRASIITTTARFGLGSLLFGSGSEYSLSSTFVSGVFSYLLYLCLLQPQVPVPPAVSSCLVITPPHCLVETVAGARNDRRILAHCARDPGGVLSPRRDGGGKSSGRGVHRSPRNDSLQPPHSVPVHPQLPELRRLQVRTTTLPSPCTDSQWLLQSLRVDIVWHHGLSEETTRATEKGKVVSYVLCPLLHCVSRPWSSSGRSSRALGMLPQPLLGSPLEHFEHNVCL